MDQGRDVLTRNNRKRIHNHPRRLRQAACRWVRPVFDLCGAYVGKALAGFDKVSVTITKSTITITGKSAAVLFPVILKALEVAA